jgi:hypothetical protein
MLFLHLPLASRSLQQLSKALPGRREDIEGDASLLVGDCSVGNIRWNNIDIAFTKSAPVARQLKLERSFKDRAYLLLPMLVDRSHGSGLEVDEADIQTLPENRPYDDAGFNGQRRDILLDVQIRGPKSGINLIFICWTEVRRFFRHPLTSLS